MFWPFNREQRTKARASAATIAAIYGMIVAQARLPAFYERGHVPDTVNGRFDMVLLHLWLVMRRLRADPAKGADPVTEGQSASALAQGLLNRFCSDMDDNLREMGVSDLKVPKRMVGFAEAFYGRAKAYDAALDSGDRSMLVLALSRNIYGDPAGDVAGAAELADYVVKSAAALEGAAIVGLGAEALKFPDFKAC